MSPFKVRTVLVVAALSAVPACSSHSGADARPVRMPAVDMESIGEVGRTCLEGKGFLVIVGTDGSQEIRSPNQDIDPLPAMRDCYESLRKSGLLPSPKSSPSEDTLRARFSTLLGVQACMTAHGYPTRRPPSVDSFIHRADDWHPYDAVLLDEPVSPSASNSLSSKLNPETVFVDCPDQPPAAPGTPGT